MDDSTSAALTEITVRIPADLARRLGTGGEVERRVLEALALDKLRQGRFGRVELCAAAAGCGAAPISARAQLAIRIDRAEVGGSPALRRTLSAAEAAAEACGAA